MNIFLINDKTLSKGDKVQLGISYFLQVTLITAIFYFIYHLDWVNTFLTSGIFVLTSLPAIFRKSYKVRLPVELDFIVILFIYAALFLGEVHGYYTKFWWWDILLHASSGVLFGIAGFLLVYILNQEKKVMLHLKPFFIGLFSFAFANALGVLWEIFEFAMDSFFSLNMQKSGLVDTMWDLIVNVLGSLFIAVFGYFYSKSNASFVKNLVNHVVKKKIIFWKP